MVVARVPNNNLKFSREIKWWNGRKNLCTECVFYIQIDGRIKHHSHTETDKPTDWLTDNYNEGIL